MQNELENTCPNQIWNLSTVSKHFDRLSHAFSSEVREIPATSWNVNIFKTKNLFANIYCSFAIFIIFSLLWKKGSASYLNSLVSYSLRKMWLLECSKGLPSEHYSPVNVLADPKRSWHLHGRAFILIFHYSQTSWVGKHPP